VLRLTSRLVPRLVGPLLNLGLFRPSVCLTVGLVLLGASAGARGQKPIRLAEPSELPAAYAVELRTTVTGKLLTAIGEGKAASLPLKAQGRFEYVELLVGRGAAPVALFSIRHYRQARSEVEVSGRKRTSDLSPLKRRLVALGRPEGVLVYCPDALLSYDDVQLLQTPGDSLAVLPLLPDRSVDVGQSWQPAPWVLPMLAGVEAVKESRLTCRLQSVESGRATVTVEGQLEGAVYGAVTSVKVRGTLVFNTSSRCLTELRLTQTEKRMIGSVSPGLDVEAKVELRRRPTSAPEDLLKRARQLSPDPPPDRLLLQQTFFGDVVCQFDRRWHVFHASPQVAVLRLVENGTFLSQCNLSPIPSAPPGRHVPKARFVEDIQRSLGERFQTLVKDGEVPADDGRFIYRVVVHGKDGGLNMQWNYYLVAAPNGRQVSLVFAVERENLERFGDRDLQFVRRLRFLSGAR